MIRIKAIAPLKLDPAEVRRRQARYDVLADDHASITLVNLEDSNAPQRLDSEEDIRRSEKLVYAEMLRTSPGEFDFLLPDCVLDPAIGDNFVTPVPARGILKLASTALHQQGTPYLGVTRNNAIGDEFSRKVRDYGYADDLKAMATLDVDFCFIADHRSWAKAMWPAIQQAQAAGLHFILNGCSAVAIDEPVVDDVRVIDPTALALESLCTSVTL